MQINVKISDEGLPFEEILELIRDGKSGIFREPPRVQFEFDRRPKLFYTLEVEVSKPEKLVVLLSKHPDALS